ncbi:CAP domain-containing protein [Dokdonia sp.]|uniref:CAP domain-containing protein n=1 Tax=Dokdonia sp. TaxID=2024995 RepID=UPI003264B243
MIKKILLLFFFLSSVAMMAQLSPSHKEKLAVLITERVNEHRKIKKRQPLSRHEDLAKAAQWHSDYMVKKQRLSHEEKGNGALKTPRNRVEKYSAIYEAIGENILYSKPIRTPINKESLKKIAIEMYRSWKNSPGHYANMISDVFDHGDLAFTYDPKSKRIYATHVFAKKGAIIPGQLSEDAFGITSSDSECVGLIGNKSNLITNMGNSVRIEGDEIILRYHDIQTVRKVISNIRDGIAIDLIAEEQLICGNSNQLDASPIYDGVLLKPIYRDVFFASNTAKSDFRLIVSLGKVPEHLRDKSLSASIVIIKSDKKCSYTIPTRIPRKDYPLRKIPPIIYTPKIALKTTGIKEVQEVYYKFKTDATIAYRLPEIDKNTNKLYKIDIRSYASVDGNESHNKNLHKQRAQHIKGHLTGELTVPIKEWDIQTSENWELNDFQMEIMGLDDLIEQDQVTKRAYINKHSDEDVWNTFLSEQRSSKAVLYWKGSWSKEDTLHPYYNLINALLENDTERANKALALLYKHKEEASLLTKEFILDRLFYEEELVQNTAALLLRDIHQYKVDDIIRFVRKWLKEPELLSEDAQKNLLNLYTITTKELVDDWDTSSKRLAKVMHPRKLESFFESYTADKEVAPLFLNFHMAIIDYYGQINEGEKILTSFDFITNYFENKSLSIKDDTDLALFFNNWSRYDLTLEILEKAYKAGNLDEESLFVYIKTAAGFNEDIPSKRLKELHKRAIKQNKERWCYWMRDYFQNLRFSYTKSLYCKECSEVIISVDQLLKDQN